MARTSVTLKELREVDPEAAAAVEEAAGLSTVDGSHDEGAAEVEEAVGVVEESARASTADADPESAANVTVQPDSGEREVVAADSDPEPEYPPVPDPFDDVDALEDLEHEIRTLQGHINAATYREFVLIDEFVRRRGWELAGHRSPAHWLHCALDLSLTTAREWIRVARALRELPETSALMARGGLSYSQVRALTRVATPECEAELLEVARAKTADELEQFARRWREGVRGEDEEARERERYRLRRLVVVPDDGGMYAVRGRVPAEVGAVLMRALEAAGDALFCPEAVEETTPKQRWADALGLVAERAMAAGFGGASGEAEKESGEEDASAETSGAPTDRPTPVSEGREEIPEINETASAETLGAGTDTDRTSAGAEEDAEDGHSAPDGSTPEIPEISEHASAEAPPCSCTHPSPPFDDNGIATHARAPVPLSGTRAHRYQAS